jgi:endonuclease-8
MPEGDVVWRVARNLDEALSGHQVIRSDFRVPDLATADFAGRTITSTRARGKHLLTEFDNRRTLHTHLLMDGAWHLYPPGGRWRRPAHQARVVLDTAEREAVGFSLGIVEILDEGQLAHRLSHLGPDILGPDWDAQEALRRLLREPSRPIGAALIDQSNLAGLGNLYRAELCFLAGVDPVTPVGSVADLQRIVQRAKALLEANKGRVIQATTGDLRRGRELYVYRRANQPCRRCATTIRTGQMDGRALFWCPTCQPSS